MPTSTSDNEKELLMQVTGGDEAAFTQLFHAYHQKLGAYVFRLTGSVDAAEEIVQETFVKVWAKRRLLANVDNFGAYLYMTSRNHALNCLRQQAKERARSYYYVLNYSEIYDEHSSEDPVFGVDRYVLIDQAVAELPPQQQKVYLLSRRAGLKQGEIASRMSLSRETVKKYLKLAVRSISNYLRTHGDFSLIFLLALGSLKFFC
ncbi:RNA polymerase sigma factor [Compostibacter hankyongensis]|uniref:RNA polymerase sigma-70 factor n=1 Tax=Compostibacter hankyongensis TaxID=1007089 RepID=A0ABP8FUA9_9BACT